MVKNNCKTHEDRLAGMRETIAITDMSRSTIIRAVAAGRFPEPIKIGPQRRWSWRLSVIKLWMTEQENQNRTAAA